MSYRMHGHDLRACGTQGRGPGHVTGAIRGHVPSTPRSMYMRARQRRGKGCGAAGSGIRVEDGSKADRL